MKVRSSHSVAAGNFSFRAGSALTRPGLAFDIPAVAAIHVGEDHGTALYACAQF